MPQTQDRSWVFVVLAVLGVAAVPKAFSKKGESAAPAVGQEVAAKDEHGRGAAGPGTPATEPAVASEPAWVSVRRGDLIDLLGRAIGDLPPVPSTEKGLRQRAHEYDQKRGRVHTVVACVPDPRSSPMALPFDQSIEALVSAAARVGFGEGRFVFPWPRPKHQAPAPGEKTTPAGTRAEKAADRAMGPGLALFRSVVSGTRPDSVDLLVVFLVGESPVRGADRRDLEYAFQMVRDLATEPNANAPLHVLGPFFSGSAATLAESIADWRLEGPDRTARVVTGTATVASIAEAFRPPRVDFSRTVATDDELRHFLFCQLGHGEVHPSIALLTESGTLYGNPDQRPAKEPAPHDDRPPEPAIETRPLCDDGSTEPRPREEFEFPLHISQLRAASQHSQKATDGQAASFRRTLELKLDSDEEAPPDALAAFSELTPYEVDLSLRQILQRICADHILYLVIVATDPLDVVFLAQQTKKYCPSIVLVTLGADLLYSHPDLTTTLTGMLIGSTYPLLFENRAISTDPRWSKGRGPTKIRTHDRQRQAFSSEEAQGFNNAALTLLGEVLFPTNPEKQPGLFQYGPPLAEPECPVQGPQLWLTTIANNRFWPLATTCVRAGLGPRASSLPTGQARAGVDDPAPNSRPVKPTLFADVLVGMFLLLTVCHMALTLVIGWRRRRMNGATAAPAAKAPPPHKAWAVQINPVHAYRRTRKFFESLVPRSTPPSGLADQKSPDRAAALASQLARSAARGRYQLASHVTLAATGALVLPSVLYVARGDQRTWVFAVAAPIAVALVMATCWSMYMALRTTWELLRTRTQLADGGHYKPCRYQVATTVVTLAAVVSIVILALWVSVDWFPSSSGLGATPRLLLAIRTVDPLGMSPLVPLAWLAAGFYLWGFFGLRRVSVLGHFRGSSPLPSETRQDALQDLTGRLLGIGKGEFWKYEGLALVVGIGLGLIFWFHLLPTFEGRPYDRLLKAGFATLYGTIGVAFVQFVSLWIALARFLRQLAAQPMVDAYDRIAAKASANFAWQLSAPVAHARELEASAYNCQALATLATEIGWVDVAAKLKIRASELWSALGLGSALSGDPLADAAPETDSEKREGDIHTKFFAASRDIFAVLRTIWQLRVTSPDTQAIEKEVEIKTLLPGGDRANLPTAALLTCAVSPKVYLWVRMAEDFVAMRLATFIYHLLYYLRNLLLFALLGSLLLALAAGAYPLHPARFVTVSAWAPVLAVIAGSLFSIITMERNEVLSRLSRPPAGRSSFNLGLLGRLLALVVLPIAAVLASIFPEVSDLLFAWLGPLTSLLQ